MILLRQDPKARFVVPDHKVVAAIRLSLEHESVAHNAQHTRTLSPEKSYSKSGGVPSNAEFKGESQVRAARLILLTSI